MYGPRIGRPAGPRSWPDAPRSATGERCVSVDDSEPYRWPAAGATGIGRGQSIACRRSRARAWRGAARCHPHHSVMLLGCSSCCRHRARSRSPCGRCQTGMSLISCDLWPRELTAQDRVRGRTYRLNDGYMKRGASVIRLYTWADTIRRHGPSFSTIYHASTGCTGFEKLQRK
jgi:hypothetical protein